MSRAENRKKRRFYCFSIKFNLKNKLLLLVIYEKYNFKLVYKRTIYINDLLCRDQEKILNIN